MEQKKGFWKTLLKWKDQENLVSHVLKIETESVTKKGDNFAGDLKRIKMDVILKSGKIVKKSIIIKEMPSTKHRREVQEKIGLFKREILIYKDVLPLMEDIMREFNDHTEFMWGSGIHYVPYQTLYLNDLSMDGYVMKDRKQCLNLDHCLLVMRSLAKLHATSVLLVERGMIWTDVFEKHIFEHKMTQQLNETFLIDAYKRLADLMEEWGPEWKTAAENSRTKLSPNVMEMLLALFKTDDSKFNVLCHGDCWINNMMFKNGLDGVTPISVKFVDFQLSFYNSPAFDLHYFIASSADLDVRKNSIPILLKTYHETLCDQLKLYSFNGKILTYDDLVCEMERIELFGFNTAMSILPVVFMENVDGIPDMEQHLETLMETNEVDKESWSEYFKPSSKYNEFIKVSLEKIKNTVFA